LGRQRGGAMRKTNVLDLGRMKAEGAKIVTVTAYDALFARIFDDAGRCHPRRGLAGMVCWGTPYAERDDGDMVRHTRRRHGAQTRVPRATCRSFRTRPARRTRSATQAAAPGGSGRREARGGAQCRGNDPANRVGGHPSDGHIRAHPAVDPPDGRLRVQGDDPQRERLLTTPRGAGGRCLRWCSRGCGRPRREITRTLSIRRSGSARGGCDGRCW